MVSRRQVRGEWRSQGRSSVEGITTRHRRLREQRLGGSVTALNQSRVKMWRRCQKQYAFRYDYPSILGEKGEMVPKRSKKPLTFGTWLHELARAHNYEFAGVPLTGQTEEGDPEDVTWQMVHARLKEQFEGMFIEEREELGDDLPDDAERLFRAYLRFWGRDSDRYAVAQLDDGSPAIEFVVEVPLTRWGIEVPFKGRIDLLVEDNDLGGLWIRDYKFVSRIPAPDERMMSPQACMYVWALRKTGYDVRGFVFDYARKKAPTIPTIISRGSKYGPAGCLTMKPGLDTDYYTYLNEIRKVHGDRWKEYVRAVYMQRLRDLQGREALWFRREPIPVEPERIQQALREYILTAKQIDRRARPTAAPRSYFYSCPRECEYHGLCVAEFTGLDIDQLVKHDYQFVPEKYDEREDLLSA
jgi:PD-(D/E)XK nuclease superfamily